MSTAKTLAVSRKEFKSLLSLTDRIYLISQLDTLLTPDAYGGYNGYRVRSLYFDSIDNVDITNKNKKSPYQRRIRMRIYSTKDKTVKVELKRKSFGRQLKESVIMSREDAMKMINEDYSPLLEHPSDTAKYLYEVMTTHSYRPVSIIEYDRRAYTHPFFSTRITLDSNVRYTDFSYDLFSDDLNFKRVMDPDQTILEVKYDRFLFAQIQDVLSKCNLTKKPMSKYGSSRQLLKQYYY